MNDDPLKDARIKMQTPFMRQYIRWYEETNNKPFQFPVFNHEYFDVEQLWLLVRGRGGSAKVTLQKQWAELGRKFNPPPYMTNLSTVIKSIYERYLLDYEQVNCPSGALPGPSSASCTGRKRRRSQAKQNSKSQKSASERPASSSNQQGDQLNLKEQLDKVSREIVYLNERHEEDMYALQVDSENALRAMYMHAQELEVEIQRVNQQYEQLVSSNGYL
eukprot:TRINITY_DN6102_c0_g2_i1.p1 TRINITY_DN6102_c0_g2~~TRINITY_DN6102_c0_g2_i1.p1  ORF type:complete len:218 (-),score=21.54 TRINITY_DN6102_c0_g2_i1:1002-1655(-)